MASRRVRRRRLLLTTAAATLMIAALCCAGLSAGVAQGFQAMASDALVSTGNVNPHVVVIGIDEPAQAAVGEPWPWTRETQARLVKAIAAAGAAVVVYDVALTAKTPGDAALAAAARGAHVVYAVPVQLARGRSGRFLETRSETRPTPPFDQGCLGHAAITQDPADGVVRSLPLLVEDTRRRLLPSLALAALLCRDAGTLPIVRAGGVQAGAEYIPTEARQRLRLRYSEDLERRSSAYISAAQLLGDRPPRLPGAVVLVGVTDPTLGDTHLVPGNKTSGIPGVFIHANAVNTMLERTFVHDVPERHAWLAVFVLALVVGFAAVTLRPWLLLPTVILTAAGYVGFALYEASRGVLVQLVWPPVAAAAALLTGLVLQYLLEQRQRLYVSGLFAQYLPAPVVEQLLATDRATQAMAGERLDVTVLFCDLRGFTELAATLAPAQVRQLLDVYYRRATDLVHSYGGTLMQYVGDEVFAVFGAPLPNNSAAFSAFECARALQGDRVALGDELAQLGVPAVEYGIGLHSGEVVAAHVGGEQHRQYAVVGTTVNVGARLCSFAAAGEIAMSQAVWSALPDDCGAVDVGVHAFKGVDAVHVWKLAVS